MPHDRAALVRDQASLLLECRNMLEALGFQPTVSELLGMTRLVTLREAEARRMEFVERASALTKPNLR
jgi:hypothetical protein